MTVFFILLSIIIVLFVIITFSSIKINIENFKFINLKIIDLKVVISLAFLNKINILKITINKEKLDRIEHNKYVIKIAEKIQEKLIKDYKYMHNFEQKSIKEILKISKYFRLNNVEIDMKLGTEDAVLTSFLITTISIIITFLIARKIENIKYNVRPVYIDEIYLNLSIKCIISIKVVHIINIIKELKRKDRDKKNGRPLNRRTYASSNG